jgi:hypothetical protein
MATIIAFLLVVPALSAAAIYNAHSASAQAAATDRIYADPSVITLYPNTTSVGTLFNVSIWCNASVAIGGAEVYMEFNDSIINCTRDIIPLSDPNYFYPNPPNPTVLPAPPNPGYVHLGLGLGRVQVAVSNPSLPPAPPFGHNGLIVIFEFNVTSAPPPGGNLTCSLHLNSPINTYLLGAAGDVIANVEIDDGTYNFVPEFPTVLVLPLFLGLTVMALAVRKKVSTKPKAKSL